MFFCRYNIPYFKDIYNISGWQKEWVKHNYSRQFSYSECARARISRANHTKVTSMQAMRALMRSNDYMHDPISAGNPVHAISSRFDLINGNGNQAFGGIDCKITSSQQLAHMNFDSISGPTHESLPPFAWSKSKWWFVPHLGQPDEWNFEWQTNVMTPP